MRYRLKNVPLQTPAATAWLVRRLEERANDLLEVLAARRQNSEDVLLAPGELRVGDISPAGLRLRWPGSSRSYSLAPEFLPEIIRWLGMSAKDFVHALHESPTTLESRADDLRSVLDAAGSERAALFGAGDGELDYQVQATGERSVEARAAIAGEDGDAVKGFDTLQEIIRLSVGEAVVGLADVGALGEKGIGLVKEQDDFGVFCARQHLRQIFFRLSYVFAGDGSQVHPEERKAEASGQPTGGESFAGARRSQKKSAQAGTIASDGGGSESLDKTIAGAAAKVKLLELLAQ